MDSLSSIPVANVNTDTADMLPTNHTFTSTLGSPTPSLSRGSTGGSDSDPKSPTNEDGEVEIEYETDGSELSGDEEEDEEPEVNAPPIPQPASL
jgi:hypothetical protein